MNIEESLVKYNVPEHIHGGLIRYVNNHIAPGGFLTAVLANDLMGAMRRADDINRYHLYDICNWLHNCAPSQCYGSYELVEQWLNG